MENAKKKKLSGKIKYLIYIGIVLIATAISLTLALWGDNFNKVVNSFNGADYKYILVIVAVVLSSYLVDGLIIMVFCRLYTRRYKWHQGLVTSFVGQFYSDVTPGASGGQIMQVFTMRKQNVSFANAASIMVMWYIMYQSSLIVFDVIALSCEWRTIFEIKSLQIDVWNWSIPLVPLIIVGFTLNASIIVGLYLMSFSNKFHNFIIKYVVGFFAKIKIVKNVEETRDKLRVNVLNFKTELKRLQTNIPVIIITFIFFMFILFARFSIPYFAGLSLHAWGESSFDFKMLFRGTCLSATHQMLSGLIPLPGSAGVSELFYNYLFYNYFYFGPDGVSPSSLISSIPQEEIGSTMTGIISSTQILWRTATFHIVLIVSGIITALYRGKPSKDFEHADRKTFIDLQYQTYQKSHRNTQLSLESPTFAQEIEPESIEEKPKKEKINKKRKSNRHKSEEKWDNLDI